MVGRYLRKTRRLLTRPPTEIHRAAGRPRSSDVRQQLHLRRDGSSRERPHSNVGTGDDRPAGYAGRSHRRPCHRSEHGRCLGVSLDNVPSFAERWTGRWTLPKWGRIKVDIAFGGVYYALGGCRPGRPDDRSQTMPGCWPRPVSSSSGFWLARSRSLIPTLSGVDEIAYVMFRDNEPDGAVRHLHDAAAGTRRPLSLRNRKLGEPRDALCAAVSVRWATSARRRSIIGGEFLPKRSARPRLAAARPCFRESPAAYVYGRTELRISDDDPFITGFALSDTWGPQVGLLK
jgi:hypothetical protein